MNRSPSEISIEMDTVEAALRLVRKALAAALRDHDETRAAACRDRVMRLDAEYAGLWSEFAVALRRLHRDRPAQPGVQDFPANTSIHPVWEVAKLPKTS